MKHAIRRLIKQPKRECKEGASIRGESWHVLSRSDTRAYRRRVVAVAGFPVIRGVCARVITVGDSVKGVKNDLRILGKIKDANAILTALIRPELDVFCYLFVTKEPVIVRGKKGEGSHG